MINQDKVNSLALLHRGFFTAIVNNNITEDEWNYYYDYQDEVTQRLGLPNENVYMDKDGARFTSDKEIADDPASKQWKAYIRDLRTDLKHHVNWFVAVHTDGKWDEFIEFLTDAKAVFLEEVAEYIEAYGYDEVRIGDVDFNDLDSEEQTSFYEMVEMIEEQRSDDLSIDDETMNELRSVLDGTYQDNKPTGETT